MLDRCKQITKEGDEIFGLTTASEQLVQIPKVNSSIESVYDFFYPEGIPSHLALSKLINTLKDQGISPHLITEVGFFKIRLNTFKGFVENLEKGLITSNLISVISIDLYNDLILQAKDLRRFNTGSLNRAACVLARIVLEDGLKKICSKYNIILKSGKASEANIELKKNKIYGNTQFNYIGTWLSIGNTAAHPQSSKLDFNSITASQMDDTIKYIPEFLNKYL